ncbi:hypothetical protein [Enterocloster citroniae]|uniref:hypothetical protein n=1 Tax=Enterocloster citroniae TaxID=358743 RepID=UPI0020798EB3|nr:hypothetical protein [Enterocloster citroniae]
MSRLNCSGKEKGVVNISESVLKDIRMIHKNGMIIITVMTTTMQLSIRSILRAAVV